MNKTPIEYLDFTWNPIAMKCSRVSEGCQNCWHLRDVKRKAENPLFPKDIRDAYAGRTPPKGVISRYLDPEGRRKPARIGVQFMGDLFHEKVSDELINDVFSMMVHPLSGTSHHTFLLLTKRPDRILKCHYERFREWPNIHLGVSVESQKHLWRVEKLLKIPARVRFVSAEPLLGPIDFPKKTLGQGSDCPECGYMVRVDEDGLCASCGRDVMWYGIDWVIVGKETGPGARRMDIEWARKIRDDCKAAGVPFFMKKIPEDQGPAGDLMIREYPKAV